MLDVVRLAMQRADGVRERADAEAFKIQDIKAVNADVRFVIYCAVSPEHALHPAQESALRVIQSVGAEVTTDIDRAAGELERAR